MFFNIDNKLLTTKLRETSYLIKLFNDNIKYCFNDRIEMELNIKKDCFYNFCIFLKSHFFFQYNQLIDISVIDYPEKNCRFKIIYHFLSICYARRLRVSLKIDQLSQVSSLVLLYPSADWLEREVWDFFGIFFQNHPDLRRLLTDYGFKGYPLRKDFPLTGFLEIFYDEKIKQIVYRNVSLNQEFRNYLFFNVWNSEKTQE